MEDHARRAFGSKTVAVRIEALLTFGPNDARALRANRSRQRRPGRLPHALAFRLT